MNRCETNTTTPASVASRLTDEEIESYAAQLESSRICTPEKLEMAAVLRDYVRIREIESRIDSVILKTKKEWVNAYKKCSKCEHAINGRPRSFRGEPCYWHIDGCRDMEYVDDTEFRSKLSLLRFIKRGNKKRLLAEVKEGAENGK